MVDKWILAKSKQKNLKAKETNKICQTQSSSSKASMSSEIGDEAQVRRWEDIKDSRGIKWPILLRSNCIQVETDQV